MTKDNAEGLQRIIDELYVIEAGFYDCEELQEFALWCLEVLKENDYIAKDCTYIEKT